jgi:hypothetical protein
VLPAETRTRFRRDAALSQQSGETRHPAYICYPTARTAGCMLAATCGPVSGTAFKSCRFLEVDSWNDQHGFEVGDGVEEKLVEEMKAAHAEGEARRARIKGDFGDEESRLSNMGRDVEKLKEKLDVLAQEAGASPDLEALEVSTWVPALF